MDAVTKKTLYECLDAIYAGLDPDLRDDLHWAMHAVAWDYDDEVRGTVRRWLHHAAKLGDVVV